MKSPRFLTSVCAAARGISFAFVRERNFRIEIYLALGVVFFLAFAGGSLWQWFASFLMIAMVLAAELVNTALERVVDILKPQKHPYARVIKDIAAGMVLIVAIGVAAGGIVILGPLLVDFLYNL